MTGKPESRRGAFTLLELLVVIAIIAILAGLLLVGVMRVYDAKLRTQIRDEISQLASSIGTFQSDMKVEYLPSRLLLREDGNYNLSVQLEADTRAFLKKCFPNCTLIGMDWSGTAIDWTTNPPTQKRPLNQQFYLEGWQCLVFCLGGIPLQQNGVVKMQGFSSNPVNPTEPYSVRQNRKGPYYEFDSKRLNINAVAVFPGGAGSLAMLSNAYFPGYNDPQGVPYAYFSSYQRENGYNRYLPTLKDSDCASMIGSDKGVAVPPPWPYYQSVSATGVVQYHNPKTFQIISAGKDTLFGPGGLWPPTGQAGAGPNPLGPTAGLSGAGSSTFSVYAADDMTNFTSAPLGSR